MVSQFNSMTRIRYNLTMELMQMPLHWSTWWSSRGNVNRFQCRPHRQSDGRDSCSDDCSYTSNRPCGHWMNHKCTCVPSKSNMDSRTWSDLLLAIHHLQINTHNQKNTNRHHSLTFFLLKELPTNWMGLGHDLNTYERDPDSISYCKSSFLPTRLFTVVNWRVPRESSSLCQNKEWSHRRPDPKLRSRSNISHRQTC